MAKCQTCRMPGRGVTATPDGAGRRPISRTPPHHKTLHSVSVSLAPEMRRWQGYQGRVGRMAAGVTHNSERSARCYKTGVILATSFEKANVVED